MKIDKNFYKEELRKYLKILYNFIETELLENNFYYTDLDLYDNLDILFDEENYREVGVMEEKNCEDCYYHDVKNVCLSVKSKFFMCRTDQSIVQRVVKDCFVEKNKEKE